MAIQWVGFLDDARLGNVGGTFEFFDVEAQNIIIRDTDDALVSTYDAVDLGQWFDSVFDDALRVGNFGLSQFVPRHAYNGEIWGVGITPTLVPAEAGRFPTPAVEPGFYIYRYQYYKDVTNVIDNFDTSEQTESQIQDAGLTLKNVGEAMINKTSSLFTLGSKVTFKIGMGDSTKLALATVYMDEINWTAGGETMDISGRNGIGYFLSDQTFDENRVFSGTRLTVVQAMLANTGLDMSKVIIQEDATVSGPTFEPTDTILEGLNYVTDVWGWRFKQMPDGRLIIGDPAFLETYMTTTAHAFENNECFTRNINQRIEGAYSRLALRSTISAIPASEDPVVVAVPSWTRTVFVPLSYLDIWNLGNNRTLYIKILDDQSQISMEEQAALYAKAYQYIGINMSREISIHPEIAAGDTFVISDLKDGEFMEKGIITNVAHKVSVAEGVAKTVLSVDSGGSIVNGETEVTTYTAKDVTGVTRQRELLDVIKREILDKLQREKKAQEE